MSDSAHPIFRYMYISGSGEGWGLYAEKLADEMGLYSSELDRLGMLSNEAYRAARLVVDPGIHVLGWSRDEAIQYMLDHTAQGVDGVTSEIDRITDRFLNAEVRRQTSTVGHSATLERFHDLLQDSYWHQIFFN